MKIAIRAAGVVAAVALLLTACVEIPSGVTEGQFGSIDITVVDQNGAAVPEPTVTLLQKNGSQILQMRADKATAAGFIHYFNLQAGTLKGWADPPPGYTGGGEANAVPITIVAGQTVTATLTLTKQ
jgi:hypothetical protein